MKFQAKIEEYSFTDNKLTLQLSFVTDETLAFIEKGKELDKFLKFEITIPRGEEGSYEQQKKIWAMTRDILIYLNRKNNSLLVNSENLRAVYETSIRPMFPARTIEIDGTSHSYLPSMSDLTMEERGFVIQRIEDTYSVIGIDFSE